MDPNPLASLQPNTRRLKRRSIIPSTECSFWIQRDISVVIVGDPPLSDFIKKFFIRAALNHSHIGTLYDVGPNFLVMELVEGESSQNISSRRSTTVS